MRDLASKSYCWSPNLLGTPCLGAATISSTEEGLKNIEDFIAKSLEEMNKKKIVDNFKDLELQGDINNQGICKIKNKLD